LLREEVERGEELTCGFKARNARNLKCLAHRSERKAAFNRKPRRGLRLTLSPSLVVF